LKTLIAHQLSLLLIKYSKSATTDIAQRRISSNIHPTRFQLDKQQEHTHNVQQRRSKEEYKLTTTTTTITATPNQLT